MSNFSALSSKLKKLLALTTVLSLLATFLFSCGESELITLDDIPSYSGSAYVEIDGNRPLFTSEEITDKPYLSFSNLDELGRAGAATACLHKSLMPTEEREPIFSVNPTGMYSDGISNNNKYKFIEDGYVYNRCHLIGFQLCGENANAKNLITGTRYMNVEGMLPFENKIADYIERTGGHVMYRATPMYRELDFLARGVLLEGYSVEDKGVAISFCVFVYNIQDGVVIDYYSGENRVDTAKAPSSDFERAPTYALNTNSKKYHLPECHYAESTNPDYLEYYTGARELFLGKYSEYSPCMSCKPHNK